VQLRADIFGTVFNPTNRKNGLKLLRKRFIGPSIVNWYMPNNTKVVNRIPQFYNEETEYWKEKVLRLKMRGKGPPKKGMTRESAVLTIFLFFFCFHPTRRTRKARDHQGQEIDVVVPMYIYIICVNP